MKKQNNEFLFADYKEETILFAAKAMFDESLFMDNCKISSITNDYINFTRANLDQTSIRPMTMERFFEENKGEIIMRIVTSDYCDVCKTKYPKSFNAMLRIDPIDNKEYRYCPDCERKRWGEILRIKMKTTK